MKKPRLNILYLHAHDAGRHVQPYGFAAPTPHLQKLAESGMLFRQAFCANPTCSPSRACLMTGQYAHTNGMLGLAHRGFRLNDYNHTLVHYLRENGWHTALAGMQHIAAKPAADAADIGYGETMPTSKTPGDSLGITEAAEAFLARNHQTPFFLDVGYFPPHRDGKEGFPKVLPAPDPNYVCPPPHLPDNAATRRDYAEYLASVATFDAMAGRVLAALKANGLEESTLVVCTTDHGIAFPGMKCSLTDRGTGVMLILRGPGGFSGGKVSDQLVSQIDLFPTLCDTLGLAVPEWVQGVSALPLAENPDTPVRDEVFGEVNFHAAYEPMRSIRTREWKFIRRFHNHREPIFPNCDNGPSKTHWYQSGWKERELPGTELYDLTFDPGEQCNLAADPRHADTAAALDARLRTWMEETADPILDGPLDATGKTVTPPTSYSPAPAP